jgi:hypothetical protein
MITCFNACFAKKEAIYLCVRSVTRKSHCFTACSKDGGASARWRQMKISSIDFSRICKDAKRSHKKIKEKSAVPNVGGDFPPLAKGFF